MGNNEEVFFMEGVGDSFRARHCFQCFAVSMVLCVPCWWQKRELCLMLCPDRDTLLDVSTRYLWVQGFSGSMVQWFR